MCSAAARTRIICILRSMRIFPTCSQSILNADTLVLIRYLNIIRTAKLSALLRTAPARSVFTRNRAGLAMSTSLRWMKTGLRFVMRVRGTVSTTVSGGWMSPRARYGKSVRARRGKPWGMNTGTRTARIWGIMAGGRTVQPFSARSVLMAASAWSRPSALKPDIFIRRTKTGSSATAG